MKANGLPSKNNRLKSEGKSEAGKAKDNHQLLLCAGVIAEVPKS
jgi:hypothetical protein